MSRNGYIKLHRSVLDWEWYKNPNTFKVFIHLMLTVNREDHVYQGAVFQRGQRYYTCSEIATHNGLTIQQTRTALKHLQSTNEITIQTTPKGSIITVNNFGYYQETTNRFTGNQHEKQTQINRQSTRRSTTIQEIEKLRNRESPPIVPPEGEGFDRFWLAYPKKVGKGAARTAWKKIRPGKELIDVIVHAVEKAKKSEQWAREKGRYIPNPATWLNQERWEDEYVAAPDRPKGNRSYDLEDVKRMFSGEEGAP